ncbi:MAG: hypothetical protein RI885_2393 [Actinomycetota bacterium]
MQKKTIWITTGAIATALVLGGVGVAVADPFDSDRDDGSTLSTFDGTTGSDSRDDDGRDDDLTGDDLQRASAAALIATDGGTVTGAESSGSSNHAFEVDVTLPDGSAVDVYLAEDFSVVKVESSDDDGAGRGSDDSDDRSDDTGTDDSTDDRDDRDDNSSDDTSDDDGDRGDGNRGDDD